ncbi:MAG: sulfate ABC transporter permease subunit CysW, partial [Pseudorhodobacter sp.]|nr:sulfate ABC transporter permease subunit CysW [Pseudorhodobacter sp.]
MFDPTTPPAVLRHDPRAFRRATEESPIARWCLIVGVVVVLAVLIYAPLAVVFAEALAKGVGAALTSLTKPDAWSAVRLTLTVAAVVLPLNAAFGIAAAWA